MAEPARMREALPLSFLFYALVYVGTGVPVVLRWGGAVANPVNVYVRGATLPAVLVNGILVYSTMLARRRRPRARARTPGPPARLRRTTSSRRRRSTGASSRSSRRAGPSTGPRARRPRGPR